MPRGVYIRTEKIKQKMSKAKKGENNPMYGKSLYSVWLTLYGKEEADIKQNKLIEKRTKTVLNLKGIINIK